MRFTFSLAVGSNFGTLILRSYAAERKAHEQRLKSIPEPRCDGKRQEGFRRSLWNPQREVTLMAREKAHGGLWLKFLAITVVLGFFGPAGVWAAKFRITFNDGNRVEVPYCWEAKETVFFEIPGGVAGIPKSQVRSIQEIVAGSEIAYDSTGSRLRTAAASDPAQQKEWASLLKQGSPFIPSGEPLSPEELTQILTSAAPSQEPREALRLYRTSLTPKGDFAQWMRIHKNGAVLVVKYLLNIQEDLTGKRFELILYDGHDRIVQRQPCSVQPVEVPEKLAAKLGVQGRLFAVVSTIKPDPTIRRYELAALR